MTAFLIFYIFPNEIHVSSHMICLSYNVCPCGASQQVLDIGCPNNAMKLRAQREIITDARNDSFFMVKSYSIPVI